MEEPDREGGVGSSERRKQLADVGGRASRDGGEQLVDQKGQGGQDGPSGSLLGVPPAPPCRPPRLVKGYQPGRLHGVRDWWRTWRAPSLRFSVRPERDQGLGREPERRK